VSAILAAFGVPLGWAMLKVPLAMRSRIANDGVTARHPESYPVSASYSCAQGDILLSSVMR